MAIANKFSNDDGKFSYDKVFSSEEYKKLPPEQQFKLVTFIQNVGKMQVNDVRKMLIDLMLSYMVLLGSYRADIKDKLITEAAQEGQKLETDGECTE